MSSFRPPSTPTRIQFAGALLVCFMALGPVQAEWQNRQEADLVLGQPNFISAAGGNPSATNLGAPSDVAVDPVTGNVFVCDTLFDRVLRYDSLNALMNGAAAVGVLGQPDFVTGDFLSPPTAASMKGPSGIALDAAGTLWVADTGNHRVLKFTAAATKADADGATADGVLGQSGFTTNASGTTATTMKSPSGVAVDINGTLYVADTSNNRVLRFSSAAGLGNGAAANGVLGQGSLQTANSVPASIDSIKQPKDVEVGPGGVLWVADTFNFRVLRFDNPATQADADGADADGVLGQPDFDTRVGETDQESMITTDGVAVSPNGDVWVTDEMAHRVLLFRNAAAKDDGDPADIVLGQSNFTTTASNLGAGGLNSPAGIFAADNATLLLADNSNKRVLRYRDPASLVVAPAPAQPDTNLQSAVKAKIKKLKKAIKRAKKKNQDGKAKRLRKKLKRLLKQLNAL